MSRPPSDATPAGVDCLKCRHFQVTWEPDYPRGCRAMGFKTALWPWQEVLRSSGEPCLRFEPKPANHRQEPSRPAREGSLPPVAGGFSRKV
ncbi:MAG: hypothetical protein HQM03_00525 [Magnetococcales bacterium]|nr:hypothetical protein [Magnetococcales bacterium]